MSHQAHHHDHAERDEELDHEFADGVADVDRLVRNLREDDAGRQLCGYLLSLALEGPTEIKPVPAILHDDAEHEGWLAVVADQECGAIFVTALHIGDVDIFG